VLCQSTLLATRTILETDDDEALYIVKVERDKKIRKKKKDKEKVLQQGFYLFHVLFKLGTLEKTQLKTGTRTAIQYEMEIENKPSNHAPMNTQNKQFVVFYLNHGKNNTIEKS
jgi:hypothetical protein